MNDDSVIREVRAARDAFARSHGYDIRAMVVALRELDSLGGREVVRFPPRPASPVQPNAEVPRIEPADSPAGSSLTNSG